MKHLFVFILGLTLTGCGTLQKVFKKNETSSEKESTTEVVREIGETIITERTTDIPGTETEGELDLDEGQSLVIEDENQTVEIKHNPKTNKIKVKAKTKPKKMSEKITEFRDIKEQEKQEEKKKENKESVTQEKTREQWKIPISLYVFLGVLIIAVLILKRFRII